VLPDDQVRLAPFDTYAAEDYEALQLSPSSTLSEALAAVAPNAGAGTEPGPLQPVDFACAVSVFTPSLEDARGTTFVGRYIRNEVLPGPGVRDVRMYWSVERVYAGGPVPELLTLRSSGCEELTLKPGKRYLFSTADAATPGSRNSLAWRLSRGGAAKLQPFKILKRDLYTKDVRSLKTFDDALAAVASDSQPGQTPTRAGDRTPG
jgi:hypothetical protein